MEDKLIGETITNLIHKQNSLDEAEALLIKYLEDNPKDIEVWRRLVILETLSPFEDYERASEYLQSALRIDEDNAELTNLLLFFTEWYLGGLNESQIKLAQQIKSQASKDMASIASYILAWHFKSKNPHQFTTLMKESIQEFPQYVFNYTDLGKHYLDTGNVKLGRKLIEEGLANVREIYSGSDQSYDPTDVTRFINERITGLFMAEGNYNSLKVLTQN